MKTAITGAPGIGKTTICEQLAAEVPGAGGIITTEQRNDKGLRVGFSIQDVHTGEHGTLAHIDITSGPKVGKYGIDRKDCERILIPAMDHALNSADWILLDEVGPMELKVNSFLPLVRRVLKSNKPIVLTYQQKLWGGIVEEIKRVCKLEVVTKENRDGMAAKLAEILKSL